LQLTTNKTLNSWTEGDSFRNSSRLIKKQEGDLQLRPLMKGNVKGIGGGKESSTIPPQIVKTQ